MDDFSSEDPLAAFDAATKAVPLLMTTAPSAEEMSANPQLAALQSLLYDDTPETVAENFKRQGNEAFRAAHGLRKKLKDAAEFYTKGLAAKGSDIAVNAALLLNRAAVNLELENYRAVKEDCAAALKLDEKLVKAYFRWGKAHRMLEQHDDALAVLDRGLQHFAGHEMLTQERKLVTEALEKRRALEQAKRRLEEERRAEEAKLNSAIKAAGVTLVSTKAKRKDNTEFPAPSLGDHKVHLDEAGRLHWPTMFLYPEAKQTDVVGDFCEENTFQDQLDVMFQYATPAGKDEPCPPWDPERKYQPSSLEIYFEVTKKDGNMALARIGNKATLHKALAHPQFTVHDRLPAFLVVCKDTPFYQSFLAQYKS